MPRRQTSNIQRRPRATEQALTQRIGTRRGPDIRLIVVGVLLAVALLAVLAFVVLAGDVSPIGQVVPEAGREHISDGSPPQVASLTSTPATSGPHWDSPAQWGVYQVPLSDAQTTHNLEHGGIVIWYDPERISPEDRVELTSFVESELAGSRFKFILSPWGGHQVGGAVQNASFDHAIAVTAWTRLLYQDELDLDQVRAFADRYYQRLGPEPGGGPPAPG